MKIYRNCIILITNGVYSWNGVSGTLKQVQYRIRNAPKIIQRSIAK